MNRLGTLIVTLLALWPAAAAAAPQQPAAPVQTARAAADTRVIAGEAPESLAERIDALDAAGQWQQALPLLERLVAREPHNAARRFQLARYLSWLPARRSESSAHFEQALAAAPERIEWRLAFAEALSWEHARRAEAVAQYQEILRRRPGHPEAQARLAEVWSWQRQLGRAENLYDGVLAEQPAHALALTGKGEILTWSGRHFQAARVLDGVPTNQRTPRWHLARATSLYSLGQYDAAAGHLSHTLAAEPEQPYALRLLDAAADRRGTHVEAGFALARSSGDPRTSRLDFDQPFAVVRFPVNAWSRMEAAYTPTRYFNRAASVREQRFALAWEGRPGEGFSFRGSFAGAQYARGSADLNGAFVAGWRLSDDWELDAGFTRAPLLDSVQSAAGMEAEGLLVGRGRANLVHLEVRRYWRRHDVDLYLRPSVGAVTGSNLDANRRAGVDFGAGKFWRLPRDHSFRLGYGFTWFGFDENFGAFPAPAPARDTGGYFSPASFFNNVAQASLEARPHRRWSYELLGNLGVQHTDTAFGAADSTRLSSYARAAQTLRLAPALHFTAAYEFTDAAGAFRRHAASVGLRFYPGR